MQLLFIVGKGHSPVSSISVCWGLLTRFPILCVPADIQKLAAVTKALGRAYSDAVFSDCW